MQVGSGLAPGHVHDLIKGGLEENIGREGEEENEAYLQEAVPLNTIQGLLPHCRIIQTRSPPQCHITQRCGLEVILSILRFQD